MIRTKPSLKSYILKDALMDAGAVKSFARLNQLNMSEIQAKLEIATVDAADAAREPSLVLNKYSSCKPIGMEGTQ